MRAVSYTAYAFLSALVVILLLSDINNLRWAGVLLLLFLGDRLLHLREGEKSVYQAEEEAQKKKQINLAELLTPKAYRAISYSFRKSIALDRNFYIVLLRKLAQEKDVREMIERLDINLKDFIEKAVEYEKEARSNSKNELLGQIKELVQSAYNIAVETGEEYIEPRNLFAAIAEMRDPSILKLLDIFELSSAHLKEAVVFGRYKTMFMGMKRMPSVLGEFAHRQEDVRKRIMNRAWTARPTPFLDQFSIDLTALARQEKVGFLVGHKKEFKELLNVLARPTKPNALLIGEPGTGKSSLIAHLAFRIIKDKVPEVLFDKRLIQLEISNLIADAEPEKIVGRLKKVTEEIINAGNVVLFIPNIHDLFRPLGNVEGALSAMDILLTIIRNNAIPVIGETYPREFKQYIEGRSDFLEQFEIVKIEEISEEEAVRVLTYQSLIFENQFNIFITLKAIKRAVYLAYRYLHNRPLPSSAINLLKQSLARAQQEGMKILNEKMVIKVAETLSKIPIQQAGGVEAERLINLEKIIHKRIINQEAAVSSVARALREYRSGLSRRGGPIASFLFVGPTGVGKTELAKQIAEIQFGSEKEMIRFDMSEYQDKQSIFRFIGTPDGRTTGTLTDAVLEKPYSLVLLDELEKAHPDILNLFLQVLDDGRLTDSLGRTVNFENSIIIATSNAHSDFIKKEIEAGKQVSDIAEEIKKKLTDFFRPEFLNRFSDIIVFRNLNQEEIYKITQILTHETVRQLQETHGIKLVIEDSAYRKIAELGYSPVFGARPLRNAISENLRSVLAEKILKKEIDRGNTVKVSYAPEGFIFEVVE